MQYEEVEDLKKGLQEVNEVLCQANWSGAFNEIYSGMSLSSNVTSLSFTNVLPSEVVWESSAKDLVEMDSGVRLFQRRLRLMALKDILEKDEVFDDMWGMEDNYDTQE